MGSVNLSMQKRLLTIINIISVIPLLIYPVLFLSSLMVFEVPGSGKVTSAMVMAWLWLTYPLFIALFIFLSRKFKSISLALVASIPFLFMVAFSVKALMDEMKRKRVVEEFLTTISKDFVCQSGVNANKFITYEKEKKQLVIIDPEASDSYFSGPVGKVEGDQLKLFFQIAVAKEQYEKCLNKDGKSIFDVFTISEGTESFHDYDLKKYELKVQ